MAGDLALAQASVAPGGIVSLTDYFREAWPEVSEGCCRFMSQQGGLYPVAFGGNKYFFAADPDNAATFQRVLAEAFADRARASQMFGMPVLQLTRLSWRRRLARTRAWRSIRDTRAGDAIRKLVTPGR